MDLWGSVGLGGGTPECLPAEMIKKSQDINLLIGSGTIPGTSTILSQFSCFDVGRSRRNHPWLLIFAMLWLSNPGVLTPDLFFGRGWVMLMQSFVKRSFVCVSV